ncbi:MAG: T9SS type A sorting domain-containing protein [Prevotella sp.]|nr:T9SS type A sorting domain-containing protein [Prevotella sp.]MBR4275838.1 T9SS type A sorting domain-containing protein [Prevotella sp.]
MTKNILYSLLIASTLSFAPSLISEANARIELSDIETQQPSVRQSGSALIVSGAVGKTVYVYNLLGVQLIAIHVDSYEKRIDLSTLPKGIYPIKIGNYTKKIQL